MNDIIYAGRHPLTHSVSRHAHTGWEMVYCTAGEGVFVFDDFTLEYRQGDIAVIPPFTPHSNISPAGFCNIHINMDNALFGLRVPFIVRDDSNHFILDAFTASFFHFSGEARQRAAFLSGYGDIISCYISSGRGTSGRSEIVCEIENSITLNFSDSGFELDTYLHSLPFSYDHLRKLFRKETGITPHQYLRDKRLRTAAVALANDCGKTSVDEIARMCGFREGLYFSRMFRKKYGVPPGKYRKMMTGGHEGRISPDKSKILLQ